MARFTPETIERVKDAADIVEIISGHTDLRRTGARFTGLCPFHDERSPSFSVNPTDKLYFCFGCQEKGDVFKFVQEKEGMDFPQAVEALADRYGVEIAREEEDPEAEARRRRRGRLYEALERTGAFFVSYLWDSPKAEEARGYLKGRGLEEDVLRSFGVGFAPSAWDQVLMRGQKAGFTVQELHATGLVQSNQKGGHYDRFRGRITFPIRDQRARIVGFGARDLRPDAKPKYLNSPEGELYRKSETLYGIDRARGPIAKAGRAVVVEGYTDVLALHQAGVDSAVAIMGTAITPEQLRILGGVTDTVVLALDADRAGADAMIRAQRVAGERRITIKVAAMPEGADPADMLQAGEGERFNELVAAAIDLPTFRVQTALGRADLKTPSGREQALGEIAPVIAAMGEVVGRDELIREVADRIDTDPSLVSERVRLAPRGGAGEGPARPATAASRFAGGPADRGNALDGGGAAPSSRTAVALTPRELRERALLSMCIANPKLGQGVLGRLREDHLTPVAAKALVWLRDHLDAPMAGLPRDDEDMASLIVGLVMMAEGEPAEEGAMELNLMLLEQQRLEALIADAHSAGNFEEGAKLSRERAALTDRIAGG